VAWKMTRTPQKAVWSWTWAYLMGAWFPFPG